MINTSIEFSEFLLDASGVALLPGAEIGAPGHLRLCFATSGEEVAEACRETAGAIAALE